jgi:hypothetical protein
LVVIISPLVVPLVVLGLIDALRQLVTPRFRKIKRQRFVLLHRYFFAVATRAEFAIEHRHSRIDVPEFDSEMRRMHDIEITVADAGRELVIALLMNVEICGAFLHFHDTRFRARRPQAQPGKADPCLRREPDGAPIFKFNLGAAISARFQFHALRHRHVQDGPLKSLSCVPVNVDLAGEITHAHNSRLRIGKCRERQKNKDDNRDC